MHQTNGFVGMPVLIMTMRDTVQVGTNCSSYLLIVNTYNRNSFTFLTKSKIPPINTIHMFPDKYGLTEGTNWNICTDQGGELALSKDFRQVVQAYPINSTSLNQKEQTAPRRMVEEENVPIEPLVTW